MEQRKLKINLNVIFILVLLLNAILIYIVMGQVTDAKRECLNNPLIYGAKKLSDANRAEFSCSCSLAKQNSPIIRFNSEGMEVENPISSIPNISDFNLSKFASKND